MQNWHAIWNRRHTEQQVDSLQALIELDGFDSGAGRIQAADWRTYAKTIAERLELGGGQSVYEVGCGAGAFLYALREQGMRVGGLDYAAGLVEHAVNAMPEGDFSHGEAATLETSFVYDVVLANSVFHYFPDLVYAEEVLQRMLDKAGRAIAVLEVPDLATREESEKVRRDILSPAEYEERYRGLEHLYYAREWFQEQAIRRGYRCESFDQCVPNYAQSDYRFNCLILK